MWNFLRSLCETRNSCSSLHVKYWGSVRPERIFDRSATSVKSLRKFQSSASLFADFDFIPLLSHSWGFSRRRTWIQTYRSQKKKKKTITKNSNKPKSHTVHPQKYDCDGRVRIKLLLQLHVDHIPSLICFNWQTFVWLHNARARARDLLLLTYIMYSARAAGLLEFPRGSISPRNKTLSSV